MPVLPALSLVCAILAGDGGRSVIDLQGDVWTVTPERVTVRRDAEREFLTRLVAARDVRPLDRLHALVLEPPNLLLARDEDGDGDADSTRVIASGLGGGRAIVLHPDGWLLISGTRARFRWDGISLVRWADLASPLGDVAITVAGDLVEVRNGTILLWPGDPMRLPSGGLLDAPPRTIGATSPTDARFFAAMADPATGEPTALLGDDAALRRGEGQWRWRVDGAAAPASMAVGATPDAAELALLIASADPRQRAAAAEALVMWPRAEAAAVARDPLRALARSHVDATVRRQALASLERLGVLDSGDVDRAADDASPLVRRWAAALKADPERSLAAALADPRFALRSVALIDDAIAGVASRADDASARASLLAATRGRESLLVERLLAAKDVGGTAWTLDTLLEEAIDAAAAAREPAVSRRLIELASMRGATDPATASVLAGAALGPVRPSARKHAILQLDRAPDGYAALLGSETGKRFAHADAWVRWPGRSDVAAPALATSPEETIELGRQVYSTCLTCHGPAGRGQLGVYPPLGGSEFVTGDPERFAKILLHGLKGRVLVGGAEFNGLMPRPPIESDEEIAAVMSYVRQAFGNEAGPVSADLVRGVRERHRDRTEPWDVQELDATKSAPAARPTPP